MQKTGMVAAAAIAFALASSAASAGLTAQTLDELEPVGDWLIGLTTDPSDDAVAVNLMAVTTDGRSFGEGIDFVALRCRAGPSESQIELRVGHSVLFPSQDETNVVRVRFGDADARTEQGVAATDLQQTAVLIGWPDIEALLSSPRLTVRITAGSSRSTNRHRESWTDISGTAEP